MPLFPLAIQGTQSPLGLNPVIVQRRELLWVHTLEGTTHRLSLERLAVASPDLNAVAHTVRLCRSEPLLNLTVEAHSTRIFRSEPGNDDPC
jgi:hypothetical protein